MKAQGSQALGGDSCGRGKSLVRKEGLKLSALSAECRSEATHRPNCGLPHGLNIRQANRKVTRIYHKVGLPKVSQVIFHDIKVSFQSNPYSFLKILLSLQLCLRFSQPDLMTMEGFVLVQEKKNPNLPLLSLASSSEVLYCQRAVLHL